MISNGLGYGIVNLFTSDGSDKVEDYQLAYFQLGEVSGTYANSNFYSLSSAFSDASSYGEDTPYLVCNLDRVNTNLGIVEEDLFATLDEEAVTNPQLGFVRVRLELDEYTANNKSIREVGIFMKNPDGALSKDRPILVSYTSFDTIIKEQDIKFVINFILSLE